MRKVFVILLVICLFLLPSCKEELPGAKINIINETGNTPETYELEILFNDSRVTDTRAFHMKDIGAGSVIGTRTIVLENMPRTRYRAEVYAYDSSGRRIGYGSREFEISDSADVTITVSEMPHAFFTKSFYFTKGTVDGIRLTVTDDSGEVIDRAEFLGLTQKDSFTTGERKIRLDNVNANFTWTLYKGSGIVETYSDRIENIENQRRYELKTEEIKLGINIEDRTYESHRFDSITVSVEPIPELRSRIGKLRFEITDLRNNDTISVERPLRDNDNLYVFNECGKDDYRVRVTPIMKDGETALESLSAATEAVTNKPLEKVTFVGVSKEKPIELKLGVDTLTFDIEKNPENYTRWSEPGRIESSLDIVDIRIEGSKVTVTPKKVGAAPTTLTYTEPYQPNFQGDSLVVKVSLSKPHLIVNTAGSNITIFWKGIHPSSELYLITTLDGGEPVTTQIRDISKPIETSIPKETKVSFQLLVKCEGEEEYSEPFTYETGKENFINIVIPGIKDMDLVFSQSISIEDTVRPSEEITFEIDRKLNSNISEVHFLVDSKLAAGKVFQENETSYRFSFIPEELDIDIYDEGDIVPLEVVIAVKATDGSVYSSNITLNLNMESLK